MVTTIKENFILTLVTTVRKNLFKTIAIEAWKWRAKSGSVLNMVKTAMDLQPRSKVRGPVDENLLRGDTKERGESC